MNGRLTTLGGKTKSFLKWSEMDQLPRRMVHLAKNVYHLRKFERYKKILLFIVMSYQMSVEKDGRGFKTIIKCISKFMLTVVHATVNYKITQAQNPKKICFCFFPPSLTHHVSHLFSKNKKKCFANIKFILIFFSYRGTLFIRTHPSKQ